MELHVWARLDVNGKIQSVQSTCAQIQDTPRTLPNNPFSFIDGSKDLLHDAGDKMVPYCEKKDLIKKLDTKVDEMSMIMMEISALKERNELQNK